VFSSVRDVGAKLIRYIRALSQTASHAPLAVSNVRRRAKPCSSTHRDMTLDSGHFSENALTVFRAVRNASINPPQCRYSAGYRLDTEPRPATVPLGTIASLDTVTGQRLRLSSNGLKLSIGRRKKIQRWSDPLSGSLISGVQIAGVNGVFGE
jgi:hypothetical protein